MHHRHFFYTKFSRLCKSHIFFLSSIILLSLSVVHIPVYAQAMEKEVMATAGEEYITPSDLLLSWTIGESVIETYSDGSVLIIQGYHQPRIKVTPQQNYPANKDLVSVFPNPAVDFIKISLKCELENSGSQIKAELRDLLGKVVFEGEIVGNEEMIDIHLLANGAYILHLTSLKNNSLIGTFKIEKYK
jgi:hypothetical protein